MADGSQRSRLSAGLVDERGACFLATVFASGELWVLAREDEPGCWANALVLHASGLMPPLPMRVLPLWSTLTGLAACMEPAWRDYAPHRIRLASLEQQVLPRLDTLGVLLGLDWRVGLRGSEISACGLATELRARRFR